MLLKVHFALRIFWHYSPEINRCMKFTYENLSDNAKICMWNASFTELAYGNISLCEKENDY